MKLTCKSLINGIMAYWDSINEAARYNVKLYINDQIISTRINDRTELYCTFTGLAAIDGETVHMLPYYFGTLRTVNGINMGAAIKRTPTNDHYYIVVEAEDSNGKIIECSEKILCKVREL